MRKSGFIIRAALGASLAAVALGCATTSDARRVTLAPRAPTPAWETVLPGRPVAEAGPISVEGMETRRDAALARRDVHVHTAIDRWPQPARPSLDRARRLLITTSDRTFIYYRLERTETYRSYYPYR